MTSKPSIQDLESRLSQLRASCASDSLQLSAALALVEAQREELDGVFPLLKEQAAASYEGGRLSRDKEVEAQRIEIFEAESRERDAREAMSEERLRGDRAEAELFALKLSAPERVLFHIGEEAAMLKHVRDVEAERDDLREENLLLRVEAEQARNDHHKLGAWPKCPQCTKFFRDDEEHCRANDLLRADVERKDKALRDVGAANEHCGSDISHCTCSQSKRERIVRAALSPQPEEERKPEPGGQSEKRPLPPKHAFSLIDQCCSLPLSHPVHEPEVKR